jgi:hypothetical protein
VHWCMRAEADGMAIVEPRSRTLVHWRIRAEAAVSGDRRAAIAHARARALARAPARRGRDVRRSSSRELIRAEATASAARHDSTNDCFDFLDRRGDSS